MFIFTMSNIVLVITVTGCCVRLAHLLICAIFRTTYATPLNIKRQLTVNFTFTHLINVSNVHNKMYVRLYHSES
jgi:hypothetical protein